VQLNDDDEPSKKIQKLTRWISVYDVHPPMKQRCELAFQIYLVFLGFLEFIDDLPLSCRYCSNLDYVDLIFHIEKGHAEGMHITSVTYSFRSKSWALIMDDSARYTAQNYAFSCGSLHKVLFERLCFGLSYIVDPNSCMLQF